MIQMKCGWYSCMMWDDSVQLSLLPLCALSFWHIRDATKYTHCLRGQMHRCHLLLKLSKSSAPDVIVEEAFAHCYCTFNNLKLWYILQLQGNVHHLPCNHEEFWIFLKDFVILLYLFFGIRCSGDFFAKEITAILPVDLFCLCASENIFLYAYLCRCIMFCLQLRIVYSSIHTVLSSAPEEYRTK